MSEIGFVTVTKEQAKKIIDEAPGEMVTIMTWSRSTLVHQPTERRKKSYGKILIDIAREVTFDENEIFQTLYLDGEIRDPNLFAEYHPSQIETEIRVIEQMFDTILDRTNVRLYNKHCKDFQ